MAQAAGTHPDDQRQYDAIRTAWGKGRTKVKLIVDGKTWDMNLRLVHHKVSYVTEQGSKSKPGAMNIHHREEEWLVARTEDGLGPVFNVEPKAGCNSRALA